MKVFLLILLFLNLLIGQTAFAGRPVVLNVVMADNVAIEVRLQEYLRNVFEKYRPDLTFKTVVVKTSYLGFFEKRTKENLRLQLAQILEAEDEISFLILNTHGRTKYGEGNNTTELHLMGAVSEEGVDDEFAQAFSPIRNHTRNDLKIVLNSCSIFCGGEESAARRGMALLRFFNAPGGSIVGSDFYEVSQAFDYPEFIKFRHLLPSFKLFTTLVSLGTVLFSYGFVLPVSNFVNQQATFTTSEAVTVTLGLSVASAAIISAVISPLLLTLEPFYLHIMSRFVVNRGYYFSLRDGHLNVRSRFIKIKDMIPFIKDEFQCRQFFK